MTGWLLDINVISELRRPYANRNVVALVASQELDSLLVSTITLAEIRLGIELVADASRSGDRIDWLTSKVRPKFE